MTGSKRDPAPDHVRWLEEMPGIADVVWTAVEGLTNRGRSTSVLFTAPHERAGTTLLAAATAVHLAQHRRVPVCLVETNLRCPALAGYLGLAPMGLSDVLDERAELADCLQRPRGCPDLLVLPAGSPRATAAGEFSDERMGAILEQLAPMGQFLILDTAPVLGPGESRELLVHADASVLVLRARTTSRTAAERARELLAGSRAALLGAIFNDARAEHPFGGDAGVDRDYREAVHSRRPRRAAKPAPRAGPRTAASAAAVQPEPLEPERANGAVPPAQNGKAASQGHPHAEPRSEDAHRREVETLERRIVKLSLQLAFTESELLRLAAMKDVDPGVASVYRSVQGISPKEEAMVAKHSLLQQIFEANIELKDAMARTR